MNWDKRFLELAQHVAQWSKDPSTKVGAVITDLKRRVIGVGYNGFPRSIADTPERLLDRETKYRLVVHAEANAILNATRELDHASLYLTIPPCCGCAKLIIQSGISWVMASQDAPDRWAKDCAHAIMMLREAGVTFRFDEP